MTTAGTPAAPADRRRIDELERENAKLRRINAVLMDRVERSMDCQGGAFSLFQTAIVLEQKIRERTLELERTLLELEHSHRDLARAKALAETMRTRLSEAIEAVNEGFALFDSDDRLILCNRKYLSFWPGVADRIAPGMRFREIAELAASAQSVDEPGQPPEAWLSDRLDRHREPGEPHVHRLASGRWLQINERRTRDGGIVGVYTDITDIKELEARRRERELAEKSALLQATLDNIVQGVAVYDRDHRLVAWNGRFVELLVLPAEAAHAGAPFAQLMRLSTSGDGPALPADADGGRLVERAWRDRVLAISRNPMPDGGFVMTFTDITERKRAEEALRDSEHRIRLITDAVPAMIAYVDGEQRYRFVNRAYEDWFKRPRSEIADQPMPLALSKPEYDMRLPYVLRTLAGETVSFEMEHAEAGTDGATRYALATYIPHFGERREVLGFFALIHDITERRRIAATLQDAKESLERRVGERTAELTQLNAKLQDEIRERAAAETALRLAKADAEQANLSKTKFLAAASHDLLQPLNAARLFVSALSDLDQPAGGRAMVENLDVALASVEDLLSALLDIARLDAGAVTAEVSDFPITSVLRPLATEYAPLARERGLEFVIVPSSAVVRSDVRLLRRVVQNFIANALRYTLSGRVLVGCRRRGDGVSIEVWDSGPGVPDDKLSEIFEEFRRLDTPVSSGRDRGIGLGLAIVDRVARMLGHPVGVRSRAGHGSVFSVRVPYGTRRQPARPAVPVATAAANRLAGVTVLVLDNEPAVLAGMRALLEGWSCTVLAATCRDEAMAQIGRAPDLLIADYHLDHGAQGLEEVEHLRHACGRRLPAVMVTANRTASLVEEAKALGLSVLTKPVRPAQLRAVMGELLR